MLYRMIFASTLIVLLSVCVVYSVPPEEWCIPIQSWQGGYPITVYVAPVVPKDALPYSDYFNAVSIANPTDSTSLRSAILQMYSPDLGYKEPLYVVVNDAQNRPTWAVFNSKGDFAASERIVGFESPWPEMANKLMPQGETLIALRAWLDLQTRSSLDDTVNGEVELDFVFFATMDMDTTFLLGDTLLREPVPAQVFHNIMFADTFIGQTPGGQGDIETVKKWTERATNDSVHYVAGESRWNQYDLPGILNPVDANGYLRAWTVPFTTQQYRDRHAIGDNDWTIDLAPILAQQGIDTTIYLVTRQTHKVIAVVWMHNWSSAPFHSVYWPHSILQSISDDGFCQCFGYIVTGAYCPNSRQVIDLSSTRVVEHELGHAVFGLLDHYEGWGDGNPYDIMGSASFRSGWSAPYYSMPDCARHGYWPITYITQSDQLGHYLLPANHSLCVINPLHTVEKKFFSGIDQRGSNSYIGFSGNNRVIAWWKLPDMVKRQIIIPADGLHNWSQFPNGDVYPFIDTTHNVDSIQVGQWGNPVCPDNWKIDNIVATVDSSGDSVMALDVVFSANEPLFTIASWNKHGLSIGRQWLPQVTMKNWGAADTLTISVTSGRPDVIGDFTLRHNGVVPSLDSAVFASAQPIPIPNSFNLVGTVVPLTFHFDTTVITDTARIELANEIVLGNQFFSGDEVYAGKDDFLVVASTDTLRAYRNFAPIWTHRFTSTIKELAIGNVKSNLAPPPTPNQVVCVLENGLVYLMSQDNGLIYTHWPVGPYQRLAKPAVMLAPLTNDGYDYVCIADSNQLHMLDAEAESHHGGSREVVELPLVPDRWCFTNFHNVGPAFVLTTGAQTHTNGALIVVDTLGQRVYPPDSLPIPFDPTCGYSQVISLDRNGDGHQDIAAFRRKADSSGSYVDLITYSVYYQRYDIGTTFFNGRVYPIIDLVASRWDTASQIGARLAILGRNNTANLSNYVKLDNSPAIFSGYRGISPCFMTSTDVDGSGHGQLILTSPHTVEIFGPDGASLFPGSAPLVVQVSDSFCGAPLVLTTATQTKALWCPVRNSSQTGWSYRCYKLAGNTSADWSGTWGDPRNQDMHPFFGSITPCGLDTGITLVCNRLDNNSIKLEWKACYPQTIHSYHIYSFLNSTDDLQGDSVEVLNDHFDNEFTGFHLMTIPGSPRRGCFFVTAEFEDAPARNDGSIYWGTFTFTE